MSGEGFLNRWSRRKQEAREDAAPQPVEPDARVDPSKEAEAASPRAADELDEKSLAERLAELPRIDEIDHLTDMTRFMQPWVPEGLRREALRKLWTVDRAVRDHVIFADYALDYNTPGAAPGYGTLETTAEMVKEALASFSGDPAQTLRAMAARESGSGGRGEKADEPAAAKVSVTETPAVGRAADEQAAALPNPGVEEAAATESQPSLDAEDGDRPAALREEPVFAAPLPAPRRRHGSAAPR